MRIYRFLVSLKELPDIVIDQLQENEWREGQIHTLKCKQQVHYCKLYLVRYDHIEIVEALYCAKCDEYGLYK